MKEEVKYFGAVKGEPWDGGWALAWVPVMGLVCGLAGRMEGALAHLDAW